MDDNIISRQDAIDYLMTNMNWYDEDGCESDDDYKRECITELINGVPSAEPHSIKVNQGQSSDTISRQAAIDCMMLLQREDEETYGASIPEGFDGERAAEALRHLPPAESHVQPRREERKIGEWIYDWGDWDFETCKCSECGNHMTTPIGERYSFCPNCGADMRGERNEP